MNVLKRVIQAKSVGTQTALASLLGVTAQAVNQWLAKGSVPARRVLEIERATINPETGIPEVTRHELRPDLYPRSTCSQWIEELISAGLTEAELCKHSGVSPEMIERIRAGLVDDPGYEITKAIARLHVAAKPAPAHAGERRAS